MSDELTPDEVFAAEGESGMIDPSLPRCEECKNPIAWRHGSWCSNFPTPEVAAKRKAMQSKLAGVEIDASHVPTLMQRMRSRTLSTRSSIDIEVRTNMAKEFLTAMLNSDGDKLDKVRVAVEYADLLLEELEVKS